MCIYKEIKQSFQISQEKLNVRFKNTANIWLHKY